jgi:hypothetical protein
MWALVEDNAITKIINNPKAMVIGDVRHSRNIFSSRWTNEEREAIGLYEIVIDNSNKRDEAYYTNTNQSFDFADGVATASFGSATAKAIADSLWTQEDSDNGDLPNDKEVGDVKVKGLKTLKKEIIKQQASGLLEPTDWYNHKALDDETFTIPVNIKTYRANIRSTSNTMETAIDNAADVDALATLYEYVNTGTEENPVMERPLGEWPELEV